MIFSHVQYSAFGGQCQLFVAHDAWILLSCTWLRLDKLHTLCLPRCLG